MKTNNLKTEISLVYLKYKSIKDISELIFLLKKEFNHEYNHEDILNFDVSMTDLEIANRTIDYGYNLENRDTY